MAFISKKNALCDKKIKKGPPPFTRGGGYDKLYHAKGRNVPWQSPA